VSTAASRISGVTGVDWEVVSKLYIPGYANPVEVETLMDQLHARGIDAFLVVKEDGFAPRQWRQYDYWQSADAHIYRTHPGLRNNAHSYNGWVNIDNKRARSSAEAAAEIVTRMASFVSNPL
jgi:hypothetical protein